MDGPHTWTHRIGGHHPDETASDLHLLRQVLVPTLALSLDQHAAVVSDMPSAGPQQPLTHLRVTGVNKERPQQHHIKACVELQLLDRTADRPGAVDPLKHLRRFIDGSYAEAPLHQRMRHAAHARSQLEDMDLGGDCPLDNVGLVAHGEPLIQLDCTPVRRDCARPGSLVTLAHPSAHTPIGT